MSGKIKFVQVCEQEQRVSLPKLNPFLSLIFGLLFAANVTAEERIGDWELWVESEGNAIKGRFGITYALSHVDSEPRPSFIIRRTKPKAPVEFLIFDTHDRKADKCDYKDWTIAIDTTAVPVLGYSFENAKTELKVNWGVPADELWDLFRKGLKLEVGVVQTCDSSPGEPVTANYTFSLTGSHAAYKFVLADIE